MKKSLKIKTIILSMVLFFVGHCGQALASPTIKPSFKIKNQQKQIHNEPSRKPILVMNQNISLTERHITIAKAKQHFFLRKKKMLDDLFIRSHREKRHFMVKLLKKTYNRALQAFREHYYKRALKEFLKAERLNLQLYKGKGTLGKRIRTMLAELYNIKARIALFDGYYEISGIYFAEARHYGATLESQKNHLKLLEKKARDYYQRGLEFHFSGVEEAPLYFKKILKMLPPSYPLYKQSQKILDKISR